jgi:hypothetical protein
MKPWEKNTRIRRAAALTRPELGSVPYTLTSERLPDEGRECTVWAQTIDDPSPYRIPFGVALRGGKWVNAERGFTLEVPIRGWNYRSTAPRSDLD